MKRTILAALLLFASIATFGQTYFTPDIPPKSASYSATMRVDTTSGIVDSLRNHYFSNGNKWNLYYSAAQANQRFGQHNIYYQTVYSFGSAVPQQPILAFDAPLIAYNGSGQTHIAGSFDSTPLSGSINFVNSGAIYTALATKGSGSVTSITPGYGFTSSTPITVSGTLNIDTTRIATMYYLNNVPNLSNGIQIGNYYTLDVNTGYEGRYTNGSPSSNTFVGLSSYGIRALRNGISVWNMDNYTSNVTTISGTQPVIYTTELESNNPVNNSDVVNLSYANATYATIGSSAPPTGSAGGDLTGTYPNPTVNTINSVTKSYYDPTSSIQTQINSKQATLISGTNIKTVNSTTLLGSGNLAITTANTDTSSTGFATQKTLLPYLTKAQIVAGYANFYTSNTFSSIQNFNGSISIPYGQVISFGNDVANANTYIGLASGEHGNHTILFPSNASGTVALVGDNVSEFVNDAGYLTSSSATSTYVPYTGANSNVNLGSYQLTSGGLSLNGLTSGTITFKTQSVAGTYNWNYPTTSGSAGQVLTSGGGGSAAETWSTVPTFSGTNNWTGQNIYTSTIQTNSGLQFATTDFSETATFNVGTLTASRAITIPDATGTIALTSNIFTIKQNLIAWTYSTSYALTSITRDSNEAIVTASVVWPDGSTGTFTTDTASIAFPGAVDAYHITYVPSGGTTETITQSLLTRDSAGAVTAQPALTITP